MTSKCWFVLRQTHYPPPVFPENGIGVAKGVICLGHVIPDLKQLDNIINTEGPNEFPPDMPVYPSTAWDLTWEATRGSGTGIDASVGAPIAAALGLELTLDAGVAFERSVQHSDQFEKLETFIIQPTDEYIEDTIEGTRVAKHVEKHTTLGIAKSIFMITGIIIARGAKTSRIESQKQGIHSGPGVGVSGVSELKADVNFNYETGTSTTTQKRSDFVWAIRLAKISKGVLDRQWSHATLSKGASFGVNEEEDQGDSLVKALENEGLEGIEKVTVGKDTDVFLI
ncbi:hypothetical protein B0T10DRAFT_539197 [Thelonectria olida]|uniref:Uncharacterized protein n=1 Tax=Thelonectria olida TaxID=1576542 RepID=A0A9P8W0I8_9HYPO|nr:hypothetical protein B0T10DRAFT_539197 [Thelonectria olida]